MNKDKIIAKQDELLTYQKKLIYQLDKQPNSIGLEWRERVEGLEIEIKELSSELAQLKAEKENTVSYYCGNPITSEDTCQVLAKNNNSCEDCKYRVFTTHEAEEQEKEVSDEDIIELLLKGAKIPQ